MEEWGAGFSDQPEEFVMLVRRANWSERWSDPLRHRARLTKYVSKVWGVRVSACGWFLPFLSPGEGI